jgi:hypothetical protein
MTEPRLISKAGVPAAIEKATRYRLLNEPLLAESICRDILAVDAENQQALITLLLAITDEFEKAGAGTFNDAKVILPRIQGEYEQAYYEGIINERWGDAQLAKGAPTSVSWFRAAMRCYTKAEALSQEGDDDAILRWNTCVRIMDRNEFVHEPMTHDVEAEFGDDMPLR